MAKTKMTKQLIEDFDKALNIGLTNKSACDYCGISEPSLYEYLNKGEKDYEDGNNTLYAEFFKSFKKSKANFKAFHMLKIREAAQNGNWQASAWTLERCAPEEYGRSIKIDNDNGILTDLLLAMKEKD